MYITKVVLIVGRQFAGLGAVLTDIETSRLIQFLVAAFLSLAFIGFLYFRFRVPPHLRPARPKPIGHEVPQPSPAETTKNLVEDSLGFLDDPSDYLDDASETAASLEKQTDEVEFSAIAPRRVGSEDAFPIFVHVERVPDTRQGPDSEETFTALVLQVQRGERLSMILDNGDPSTSRGKSKLSIDAPHQSLTWRGGNLVVIFGVRAPAVDEEVTINSRLWLTAGREVLNVPVLKGKLDIAITVHPGRQHGSRIRWGKWKPNEKAVTQKEIEAHIDRARLGGVGSQATAIRTAFICHAHADEAIVQTYMAALEAASIRCEHDAIDFIAEPHWLDQAAKFIATVDVIYVFWSRSAAIRPSIEQELKQIHALIAAREREADNPPRGITAKPKPVVFVIVLDDVELMLPRWFKENYGYSRRMQNFAHHQAAKSRPRLSESANLGERP